MAWKLEVYWQIATALRHLSEKNLVHGNLKASNCLLFTDGPTNFPQPIIKIGDPGVNTIKLRYEKRLLLTILFWPLKVN